MLIIAEKPKMGLAIAEAVGIVKKDKGFITCRNNDIVTWCVGHMLELAEPDEYTGQKKWLAADLPIIPQQWKVVENKTLKAQLSVIKALLKKTDTVVHAGDPDREGQLIVDEVLNFLSFKKKVLRVILHDLSPESVRSAMRDLKPNEEFQNLSASALVRSKVDWLYGMNLTRGFTLAFQGQGGRTVRSYGRVQTPVLQIIVQRDLEREDFKPVQHYKPCITLRHPKGIWQAHWVADEDVLVNGLLLDQAVGAKVLQQADGQGAEILSVSYEKKAVAAPLPYSLSELQKVASAMFGMGAKQVLDICQSLYEKKLTSYPRTDCRYLPEAQLADAPQVLGTIANYFDYRGNPTLKSAAWNTEKVTAHNAIIPVPHDGRSSLTPDELDIFRLICLSYAQQFMPHKQVEQRRVEVKAGGQHWAASCTVTLSAGWDVGRKQAEEDEQDEGSIPEGLAKGDAAQVVGTELKTAMTTPPRAFTEGTLISAMKDVHQFVTSPEIKKRLKSTAGLGTEATRASIIETLKSRGYIEIKKKAIVSTAAGRAFVAAVPSALKDPGMTALWEQALEEVAQGKRTPEQFLAQHAQILPKQVQQALQTHFAA